MRKILFISAGIFPIPANKGGAVEELIDNFTQDNAAHGRFDITVASCAFKGTEIKKKTEGVEYFYVKTPLYIAAADLVYNFYIDKFLKDWRSMFRRNRFKSSHYIRTIVKRLDLKAYDTIIVENNMSLLKEISDALGDEYERKCMYHMHSDLVDNEEMIPYLARCRRILAVSDYVKHHLYETVPAFKDTEIVKVTNGIRISRYTDEEKREIRRRLREAYQIGENETVYLFSGRVSPEKGVLEMTRAFADALPEMKHPSRLLIVGSATSGSNKENYYYKQVREAAAQCPEHITLTGYINHERITEFHAMADAQIVPSIMNDPAPLTVLEGMSMGIFLMLSRVGGIPEYTRAYENKLFFERDENFERNIREAFLTFDREYAPHRYDGEAIIFDDTLYYHELAEAIDAAKEAEKTN